MGSIHDFQSRLASFVQSQHITIYEDELALASQIWDGLSSEERQASQVIACITLCIFQQLNQPPGLESIKKMIRTDVDMDKRIIPQIRKMALLRGLDHWQSSGNIEEAKQRILAAYEQGSPSLSLFNLGLNSLPPEIGQLTSLTDLSLSSNWLKNLPAEIGQLTGLQTLNLFGNDLKGLPIEIGQLRALITLDLTCNKLSVLPASIAQLRGLTGLYLSNNNLTSLPISMEQLTNLRHLNLNNNPFTELPLVLEKLLLNDLRIQGTQLNEQVVKTILAQCKAKKEVRVAALLPTKLAAWKTSAESDIELSSFDPFTDSQKFNLFEWLVRLEKTTNFINNRKSFAGDVCQMLKDVITNREFKETFFVQVGANNASYGFQMPFNEIFVSWKMICLSLNAPFIGKQDRKRPHSEMEV